MCGIMEVACVRRGDHVARRCLAQSFKLTFLGTDSTKATRPHPLKPAAFQLEIRLPGSESLERGQTVSEPQQVRRRPAKLGFL